MVTVVDGGGGTCSQVGIWQYQSCVVSGTGYLDTFVSGCVWRVNFLDGVLAVEIWGQLSDFENLRTRITIDHHPLNTNVSR